MRRRRRAPHTTARPGRERQGSAVWRHLIAHADEASRLGVYLSAAFLLTVAVYGAALGGHLAAWQQSLTTRAETALIAGGFGINEVIVKGRVHMPTARLHEALQMARTRTIFSYDTRAAKARLEDIGWVKSARVMRLWPSTLIVELRERKPFARWEIRGHTVLIDREGELLGPVTSEFADLPRIAGEGAHTAAADLLATLEQHEAVARQVALAKRVELRRWDLVLDDGLRVQLPARDAAKALPTLTRLLGADLPAEVTVIDMRVPGRIALRRDAPKTDAPGPTARFSDGVKQARARPL
ncbi:cell division protein FtsQ/DivIB [Dichotomicrobium thermohalophilum]|uniref:Cell division protein FtsQ n=1 Tax=Dichotomicrobium thermohalophilum TaxID=933063 RepID=A0A397QC57_9HYPH|nr:cell division protein FtsQ/DivIB [Dichotomicrobium thermohalophilum]RIA55831.1 cell division protein FtsQ [Dichotomicrobium thermohalophilum]